MFLVLAGNVLHQDPVDRVAVYTLAYLTPKPEGNGTELDSATDRAWGDSWSFMEEGTEPETTGPMEDWPWTVT